jgi:hypothetical protein
MSETYYVPVAAGVYHTLGYICYPRCVCSDKTRSMPADQDYLYFIIIALLRSKS